MHEIVADGVGGGVSKVLREIATEGVSGMDCIDGGGVGVGIVMLQLQQQQQHCGMQQQLQ